MENGPAGNGHDRADGGNGGLSESALREALRRGVISDAQLDQLLALGREEQPPAPDRPEVNIAQVLYWAGSIAVLFALGYFLMDRWKSLKPGGVLAVVLLYALAFTLSSVFLSRMGHKLAASLFALLTVGMAPIVAWSLEAMAGLWPAQVTTFGGPLAPDVMGTIRWIPIELSAALAGLVALYRRVRFAVLAVSVALPFVLAAIHSTPLLFDPWLDSYMWGWVSLAAAAALLVAGSEIDRGTRDHTDFAAWVYLVALVYLALGIVVVAGQTRAVPHSLPFVVALLFALSMLTRRGLFLLFAAILFIGYLGFLAKDVFPTATGFMVVMVASGAALILSTVAVQRRWPGLARSFSRDAEPRRVFPRSRYLYGGVLAVTLVLLAFAPGRARTLRREEGRRMREGIRLQAESRRAIQRQRDSTRRQVQTPVPPPPKRETPASTRP